MRGPDYALGEEEIDDEEEEDSSGDKDVGRQGHSHIKGTGGPYDAHYQGGDSCHAEAEHHARYDEAMSSFLVDLEDGHVGCRADDEEGEEDGAYWNVDTDCG